MPRTIHSISRMNSEWHLSGLAINRPTQNRNISKLFALIFQSLGPQNSMYSLSCFPTESRLPCIRTIVLSMKTTELPTDTHTTKHQFAVQDLPANPCSPRSAMPITRFGFFPQKFAGHIRCFLKRKVARFISSKSLVILSLCYLIYCHRLRNLNALSTGLSYQIRKLRTVAHYCLGLLPSCPLRLSPPHVKAKEQKPLLNTESVIAIKFHLSI